MKLSEKLQLMMARKEKIVEELPAYTLPPGYEGRLPPSKDDVRSLSEKLLSEMGEVNKNSRLYDAMKAAGVAKTAELKRIMALPRRPAVFDENTVEDLTHLFAVQGRCSGCELCRDSQGRPREVKLRPAQSALLKEASEQNGVFGGLGVGDGKTLVSLLLPEALGLKRAVLMVKPALKNQLVNVYIPLYAKHFRILMKSIRIVTYNDLSRGNPDDPEWNILEHLQPDGIIADEVQNLARKSSARTKRFRLFMKDHPGTIFCPLTGSMVRKGILDYAYFLELTLGHGSPLPDWPALGDWAAVLDDPRTKDAPGMQPGALLMLCSDEELELEPKAAARAGYARRLRETPGVIITDGDENVGASLTIKGVQIETDAVIQEALKYVRDFWAYDGEELEDAIAKARVCRTLSLGFFLRWAWPGGVKDVEWLEARRAWHREVREYLHHRAKPGMDSPMLVANAARRGEWASQAWGAWSMVKNREPPPVVPVWLSDVVVDQTVAWAREVSGGVDGRRSLIWYWSDAFGEKVAEKGGFPLFGAGGSGELDKAIVHKEFPVMVLSGNCFTEGKNLQHGWDLSLVTSPPSAGLTWQQLLGRMHRNGQESDEVTYEVFVGPDEFYAAIRSAYRDAKMAYETTQQNQKLLYADRVGLGF